VYVHSSGVYRAESGTVFRVIESDEGGVKVEVLKDDVWLPARIGMASLRLARSTVRLADGAILQLPT
jgi:hypothetical protein